MCFHLAAYVGLFAFMNYVVFGNTEYSAAESEGSFSEGSRGFLASVCCYPRLFSKYVRRFLSSVFETCQSINAGCFFLLYPASFLQIAHASPLVRRVLSPRQLKKMPTQKIHLAIRCTKKLFNNAFWANKNGNKLCNIEKSHWSGEQFGKR